MNSWCRGVLCTNGRPAKRCLHNLWKGADDSSGTDTVSCPLRHHACGAWRGGEHPPSTPHKGTCRCTVLTMLVMAAGAPDTRRAEGVGRKHSAGHAGRDGVLRRQAVIGESPRGCAHAFSCCSGRYSSSACTACSLQHITLITEATLAHHTWTAHADVSQVVTPWARTGTYAPPQAGLSGPQVARLIAEENTRRLLRLGNEMLRCAHDDDEADQWDLACLASCATYVPLLSEDRDRAVLEMLPARLFGCLHPLSVRQ